MQNPPEISVIMSCYNAQKYLPVCLASLKAQKTPSIEMILIDDGSTDQTGVMLEEFAKGESRATVMHIVNNGVSIARNRGIERAHGRYIAFMDADDVLEENGLSKLYEHAVLTGAQITSANHTIFLTAKNERLPVEIEPTAQEPCEIVREIIHMHRIYNNIWNKLYLRELFENDGPRLDPQVAIGEDALLNIRLYLRAKRVAHLAERTYVYRVHGESAMGSIQNYGKAHEPMMQSMNRILLSAGIKERYFRDYLQSCVWIQEKETGIRRSMARFNESTRPLVLDGIDECKLQPEDIRLYHIIKRGYFPAFYKMMRISEKITRKKWGIRR